MNKPGYLDTPQSQLAKVRECHTYSSGSLSRGNRPDLRAVGIRFSEIISPLFNPARHSGSLSLSPTFYTHTAHGCWDELNYNGRK